MTTGQPDIIIDETSVRRPARWRWILGSIDLLLIAVIVTIMNWPVLKVQDIVVDGPDAWQDRAQEIAGPTADSNFFRYDVRAVEQRLRASFGSRAACAARLEPPNQIRVRLHPTRPALWSETGEGVSNAGTLFDCYMRGDNVPIWRSALNAHSGESRDTRAVIAVGAWQEVLRGDPRFAEGASEWYRDPHDGWMIVAADGKTRIILGWRNLEARAAAVAQVLGVRDKTLSESCTIDARFDGYLVVRPDVKVARAQGRRISNSGATAPTASRGVAGGSRQGG